MAFMFLWAVARNAQNFAMQSKRMPARREQR